MAVPEVAPRGIAFTRELHQRIGLWGLFGVLMAYTLSTLDGGDIAPRVVSGVLLLLTAFYLAFPIRQSLTISVPVICLLFMACYGIAQTLWSAQTITYNGWGGVLFWLSAGAVAMIATQAFRDGRSAARFRRWFVVFGSAVCVLDLLEQASHSNKYFWLIESRYATVNGSFAYWNNFAQFVELCLPVTLWLGVKNGKPAIGYLVLSGLQIGAVIACGSRAGSALVILEFIAVMILAHSRDRNKAFLFAAGSALLVSILFAYAAGFDSLTHKLQQRDQLAVRRDINASSLAMIRERPLTGWGLGTYVPVYRMFARYDDGTYVNRAHNDWLEWTAEGGILFSAAMLVLFLWTIRPAIRSGWGIGVIAICLHALVDYPFARLGVCGWYFALVGILAVDRGGHREQREEIGTGSAARGVRRRSAASAR